MNENIVHLSAIKDQKSSEYSDLNSFLEACDREYINEIREIPLFDSEISSKFSVEQKEFFVRAFYHIRGHFHNFLWFMGNHAPTIETKQIILHNIFEEFGSDKLSHEQLYYNFAANLGINIKSEILTEEFHFDFIKKFNQEHLRWLHLHDWHGCLSAFAAYEHLDNVDYPLLSKLAESIGAKDKGLLFFKVHEKVEHFDSVSETIEKIWETQPEKVIDAFSFINHHQIKMWKELSSRILAYGSSSRETP